MQPSKNRLTHPPEPISGAMLMNLKAMLESVAGGGEIRDLDLAMLLNVPLNRLGQLKRARSSIFVLGKGSADSLPSLRASQAILIRLLLKYPEYAPLPGRPSSRAMFELLQPFMPGSGDSSAVDSGQSPRKLGFAPLFGRSYISSYKMLAEEDTGVASISLPVVRLQMLIAGKFAQIFQEVLHQFQQQVPAATKEAPSDLLTAKGWMLLRERDSLTEWMDEPTYEAFIRQLHGRWAEWFENCYLGVLRSEAVSRRLDPEQAIRKGKWINNAPVSDEDLGSFSRGDQPILGRSGSLFSIFRESFGLTSAESYWVLGLQVKAFYRFRKNPDRRIAPPTSILVRYLFRYPEDIDLLIPPPAKGSDILELVQQHDPSFRLSQLGPLFGASRVMSYDFADDNLPCPFFARRLATIFRQQASRGVPIVAQVRECVKEELYARQIDPQQFCRDGRWHH